VIGERRGVSSRWNGLALGCFAWVAVVCMPLLQVGCSGTEAGAEARSRGEKKEDPRADAILVSLAEVQRRTISEYYSTTATLRADRRASVIARTRGVIEGLLVEEGDRVRAGQPVARLENEEQTIANDIAQAAHQNAAREFERAGSLHADGLLSEQEFELRRRQEEEARHNAALTALTLERTLIRAPFSGRILVRHVDLGATVSDGTAIFDLADLSPLYADVSVPERHVRDLAPQQEVDLTVGDGAEVIRAVVERIAHFVDPETGTVKVTVAVDHAGGLRPGSFVRLSIITDTREHAIVVPRSALVAEGRRRHLYRLKADGETVEELDVSIGFETEDSVEIVAVEPPRRALQPGDRVVRLGASALSDGAFVKVEQEKIEQDAISEKEPRVAS